MLYDGSVRFQLGFVWITVTVNGDQVVLPCSSITTGCSTLAFRRFDPNATPVVQSIDLRPDSLVLRVGEALNVFATTKPYTPIINVFVRDTTVAKIAAGSVVRGVKVGTTYVIAEAGSVRDSSRVRVNPFP